jgi:hypothetical protein
LSENLNLSEEAVVANLLFENASAGEGHMMPCSTAVLATPAVIFIQKCKLIQDAAWCPWF